MSSYVLRQRIAFSVRHPRRAWHRLRGGAGTFTEVPWAAIAGLIPNGADMVEAGAADGSDTVLLARHFPKSRIVACEPVPESYAMLCERAQKIAQIEPVAVALADSVGYADINIARAADSGSADSSSLLTPLMHDSVYPTVSFEGSVRVRVLTLDALAASYNLSPRFAWLDLQGAELLVLDASPAARETLKAVYMEVSRIQLYSGMPTYRVVVTAMKRWGFQIVEDRVGAISGNILFGRVR